MDQQFIKDALRTESRIDVVKFNHLTLLRAFNAVELSTNILDAVKKSVFYAKPLPNTLEGDLTRLSIATHKLQHYLTEGTFNAPEHQEIIDINPRVFHALVGNITEAGELAAALGLALRGEKLDLVNIGEEIGDQAWYNTILFDETGMKEEYILAKVIAKLKARYPEKFTEESAINRDLVAERAILEGNSTPETATHYHMDNIEDQPIIKIMRENAPGDFMAFLRITARQYQLRQGRKAGSDDITKQKQYLEWAEEFYMNGGITLLGQFIQRAP